MRFNTLDAFNEHPQISKIPYNIFIQNFNMYDFPDYLLTIMTIDNKDIELEIARNKQLIQSQTDCRHNSNYQVWLAIAFCREDMSNSRLFEIARCLSLNDKDIFFLASIFGNVTYLNYLTESPLADVRDKIKAYTFHAFWFACRYGHLSIMKRLIDLASDDLQNMIEDTNFAPFRIAAENGHLDVIEYLVQTSLTNVPKMIQANNFEAFRYAARIGNLPVLERLIQLAPDEVQNMIKADDFGAFRFAAYRGYLPVLERLIQLAPDEVQNMIKANHFAAFRFVAGNGLLSVLERLIQLAPDEIQNMIKANNFDALMSAAENGHLAVIERLIDLYPANEIPNMIEEKNYEVFKKSTEKESLDIINLLIAQLPQAKVQDMIKADDFKVFRAAAGGRNLAIIERLIELAPTQIQNMIQANNFGAFRLAVRCDRLNIVDRLLQLVLPRKINKMMSSQNYAALRFACEPNRIDRYREANQIILERLLSNHSVLAYAESHVHEFRNRVHPFIDKKLGLLHADKTRLEQQNPNAVFDVIDSNETKLLFYVLRNLIRRNEELLHDNILFLLSIPSINSLAHTKNNELLQLAMARNNQRAIDLLLNIQAVRQLAEHNGFYRAEARGVLNLRQLARDRESSMTALSQGEQKRLARAIGHYQPMIEAAGVDQIMSELRNTLVARYEAHPATFVRQGQTCELPLQWTAFQALELKPQQKSAAMESYAKHKDHTAWRYLSKPNHWIHNEAAYVNVNPATNERWSTFEEIKSIICLFYLAAIDSQFPPTDGYTLQGRLEGFIDELALIARAHNWDKTRFRINEDGDIVMEEYDDLEGDRPSCYSGVLRRLFQSVRGHPLLIILTKSIIDGELRELLLSHFRESINPKNRSAIYAAWNNIIEYGKFTPEDIPVLTSFNISEQKQGQFIADLTNKYEGQFIEDPSFILLVQEKLSLLENQFHVVNFGHFFMDFIEEEKRHNSHSAMGFFEPNPSFQCEERTRTQKRAKNSP